jgi:iron complex outermembrane receptor protein
VNARARVADHGVIESRGLSGPALKLLTRLLARVMGSALLLSAPCLAQTRPPDLSEVSIEDLMSIEVTSASRKEQRTEDVAAAVFVITQDDIRRSGMTTIPDLLRLVPGVDVAQVNANNWAVSIRGFNGSYADKLLVLVDGRSIYNRFFSGVLWDTQQMMLDDVDRIEVIRGPGAAVWGANAVNGVINIVTRSAVDTHGGLVRVDGGDSGEQGAVRYGGAFGRTHYRVYTQWTGRDASLIPPGIGVDDSSRTFLAGFRADRQTGNDRFMFQGNVSAASLRPLWPNLNPETAGIEPIAAAESTAEGGYLLGRWTRTRTAGSSLQVQSFVDVATRHEPIARYDRRTFDVDVQYHTAVGARQDLVAGGGVRFYDDEFAAGIGFGLTPPEESSRLLTAFLQDEIGLFDDRLAITLGTQVQHNSEAGSGIQPTARVMWKARPRQRIWASASRALRTPSRYERGLRLDSPPVPGPAGLPLAVEVRGNPDIGTETFVDAEAGYRLDLGTTASLDLTGFLGRYDRLHTVEQSAPIVELVPAPLLRATAHFDELLDANTRGLEVAGHWSPIPPVRFDGSYTAFHLTPTLSPTSTDAGAATTDSDAPGTQWQLRSTFLPARQATINVAVFHVGRLRELDTDAYTRADLTAEWRFSSRLSLMAIGQNLFDAAHPEFGSAGALILATQVRRSASLRLRWTFR